MPEYLKNRYKSTAIRLFMTIIALISYVFTKISVSPYKFMYFIPPFSRDFLSL